jgi:gliding motility-associated-like protein
MKKRLLFLAILLLQLIDVKAQNLFNMPDTVCARQPIHLTSNISASSYYWGFCSGYMFNKPTGVNLGPITGFDSPTAMEIAKEGLNYYGFVVNSVKRELLRLDFGNSLSNNPSIVSLGTLNNTIPISTSKLFLTKDSIGNWFMFLCGGDDLNNSSIARIDFGSSLTKQPNSVNFGNLFDVFNAPKGIFVIREGKNYFGYVVNNVDDKLIRLEFGDNISYTPNVVDLTDTFALSGATDMIPVYDNNEWFAFVTNETSSSLTRLEYGSSIATNPTAFDLGTLGGKLFGPSSISYIKDCGLYHFMITDDVSGDLTMADMSNIRGPYYSRIFVALGTMTNPLSISRIIRDRDNVYCFAINQGDNSMSKFQFANCTNSSIASSVIAIPPVYSYADSGLYNIYFAVNEGLPNMQVQCKQIVVLPIPQMTFHNDTTICQGDSIELFIQAFSALSHEWYPNHNIDDTSYFKVHVWPEYTMDYHVVLPYANGCIVDTPVHITVSKIKADAGPDRTIYDGAETMVGGPMTSLDDSVGFYKYHWFPAVNINDSTITNPVVTPPNNFTYYLEVKSSYGCYDIDTVVIHVECNDINLPNAFAPDSRTSSTNTFKILNTQIVKLNSFVVYDRWGKKMFETTDISKGWDGMFDGNPAPVGVYVWEADGFCLSGKRFNRSGNVTLLR